MNHRQISSEPEKTTVVLKKVESMTERRQHKRWLLSSYFDAYEMKMNSCVGYLAEVSYGGMMLISKFPVQTNIVMPLRIEFNNSVEEVNQMKVVTNPVRCYKDQDFSYYSVGLKLVDLSSSNLTIIKHLIDKYAI